MNHIRSPYGDARFELNSPWPPSGDQPQAIESLTSGILRGDAYQTLLGVTGSGKTFTVANVVARIQRPTLVLAHNKTLAAQLYSEFRSFFPNNAVRYFVSYYDYYQPEAYIPSTDTFIEKDASINERIEKLRLEATKSLIERRDVIVVASVSCIYGLGKRANYEDAILPFSVGEEWDIRSFLERLVDNYYDRNDMALEPGAFRVRGDIVEVFPSTGESAIRVLFDEDRIERIDEIDPLTGRSQRALPYASIFPAQHYVTNRNAVETALPLIEEEMKRQESLFLSEGKFLEAQRISMRTRYDMEMLSEVGYCSGIENYSRYLDGRSAGEPPGTLVDLFPEDFLLIVDESHITLPQVHGMFNGDRARKQVLVDNGFRLPSCLDNRPLNWQEFRSRMKQVLFVSATPGDWEREVSTQIVEQIIRPTGVLDPEVCVVPAKGQIDDLVERLRVIEEKGERALVTTLTKRSAEDVAEYLQELRIKVRYIHSEFNAFERAELIRDLRAGTVSVLVGVNLLREGMDMPEVSLVAILDADREGFLRSHRSLIQMMGRAARNTQGIVVLYADEETESIRSATEETLRRRRKQQEYNEVHGITPETVRKDIVSLLPEEYHERNRVAQKGAGENETTIGELERLMWQAVEKLDFERAAELRDAILSRKGGTERSDGLDSNSRSPGTQSQKRRHRYSKK